MLHSDNVAAASAATSPPQLPPQPPSSLLPSLEAKALVEAAAKQGDLQALSAAGQWALAAGDYEKATPLLAQAAHRGDTEACCELGWMLHNGTAAESWRTHFGSFANASTSTALEPTRRPVKVGMKLEARDRQNPTMICVATIADIKPGPGNKPSLTIHFDGWGKNYDYTATLGDKDLFYVGCCDDAKQTLHLPKRSYAEDEIYMKRIDSG